MGRKARRSDFLEPTVRPEAPAPSAPTVSEPPASTHAAEVSVGGAVRRGTRWFIADGDDEFEVPPPGITLEQWLWHRAVWLSPEHVAFLLGRKRRAVLDDDALPNKKFGKDIRISPRDLFLRITGAIAEPRAIAAYRTAGAGAWQGRRTWWSDDALARRLALPRPVVRDLAPTDRTPDAIAAWLVEVPRGS
jgi:hypothetical protein